MSPRTPGPISADKKRSPANRFAAFTIPLPLLYYLVVIFHEWGHGITAWLFGVKPSPFDIRYGGWFLMNCDEAVPYDQLLAGGHNLQVALIGISGFTVNAILFLLSLYLLNRINKSTSVWVLGAFYWSAVLNLMALFGYIPLNTFSVQGDVGRLVHGLQISPWLVFIPGSILIGWAFIRVLRTELPKVYAFVPIQPLWIRRLLLGTTLFFLFIFLFTRGYNPFSDTGAPRISKILAAGSIGLFPILFAVCDPSRKRVVHAVACDSQTV